MMRVQLKLIDSFIFNSFAINTRVFERKLFSWTW